MLDKFGALNHFDIKHNEMTLCLHLKCLDTFYVSDAIGYGLKELGFCVSAEFPCNLHARN